MATHDYNLANQSGADFRADLNDVLQAVLTLNSSATEPTTTAAYMLWLDTANSVLKIRNGADDDWVVLPLSITADNTVDINGGTVDGISQLTLGSSTSVNSILDEDNLNSDSPTALATQQSIKAYVDSQVTAQDLDFQGDSGGVLSIDLDSEVFTLNGGTGIDTTGSENTISFAIDSTVVTLTGVQVLTNKSIDADNNTISNLEVDNLKSGVLDIDLDSVSASDDTLASAKAIKTYVDANITAQDLDVSDGTTSIAIDLDSETLSLLGGTGVSSTASGDGVTFAIGQPVGTTDNVSFGVVTASLTGNVTGNIVGNVTGQVSDISNHSTSDLTEGTNLYYTTARFDTRLATKDTDDLTEGTNLYYTTARFDTAFTAKSTSNLSEGANLYYTDERVDDRTSNLIQNGTGISWSYDDVAGTFTPTISITPFSTSDLSEGTNLYYTTARFDTRLATKDTDDLTEGNNLYYTDARFDTRLATKNTNDLTEGTNLYYTQARFDSAFTAKSTSDLSEGTNLYYTDARWDTKLAAADTDDLSEGTSNLYYTDARANSAIDARVTKSFVDALSVIAGSVQANSVALGTDTTGNYVSTIAGTNNQISVSGSGSETAAVTISLPNDVSVANDLTVAGNLTVNGTLTSLDTTNLDIEDNLFQLNAGLTGSPVNDSGMLINRGNQDNGIFMWDESADKFTLGLTTADGSATGNITLASVGTLVAALEGNVTGDLTGSVTGTVSSISNHDTDDLSEGSSNLYYTTARFDSALSGKSTSDLTEGTNLYYTTARFDSALSGKSTSDLTEGTNLYYTDARADARVNLQTGANLDLSSKSTSDLSEGTNEYFTTARARSSISASGDISYNSSTGVISFTASAAPVTSVNTLTGAVVLDTDDIAEGSTNLYYTAARFNSALSGKSTSDLTEGTNLYYTTARFDSAFTAKSTSDLSEGTNLYYTNSRADARVNLQTGSNLDLSSKSTSDLTEGTNLYYTDARFDARFDTRLATKDTDDVSEGSSNLYYTDARSRASVSASGDLVYNSGTGVFSFTERTDAEVQALITAGTGVGVSSGVVSIGQAVATSDSPTFSNLTLGGTGSIKVPSGTTAQRDGTPANGMFRYNSEDAQFEGYADGAWGAIAGSGGGASAMETNNFTGDGSTTAFTLSSSVSDEDNLLAFIEGVYQNKADFVASGTTITFDTAPVNGRNVVVHHVKASISGSNVILNSFTGDGSDTTFTLSTAPQSENNTQVHLDGVYQNKSSYSVSGTTLTFDAAPANAVAIEVIMFTQTTINEPAANTVGVTQLDLSDGTSGQVLTTDGSGTLSFSTVAGTTINNNADNRIITGSGTANTLEGEANLRFDGTNLVLDAAGASVSADDVFGAINFFDQDGGSASAGVTSSIKSIAVGNVGASKLTFSTSTSGGGARSSLTEKLVIDESGNVGIGATTIDAKLHIEVSSGDANLKLEDGSATYMLLDQNSIGGSDIIRFKTGSSLDERMRIAGNNVLLNGGNDARIVFGTGGAGAAIANDANWVRGESDSMIYNCAENGEHKFEINGTERMRIHSTGDFTVATTTAIGSMYNGVSGIGFGYSSGGYGACVRGGTNTPFYVSTNSQGAGGFIEFAQNGATRGNITYTGSATSYNASSDYRLKENAVPIENALSKIDSLNPINFDWIESGDNSDGFLAHEIQEILPYTVTGTKDEVYTDENSGEEKTNGEPKYQVMDYAKLTPVLVKAIQEQQTLIESLTTRLETLENA